MKLYLISLDILKFTLFRIKPNLSMLGAQGTALEMLHMFISILVYTDCIFIQ